MIKNYFRILKKSHAHFQTIFKTPVKFQKDWTKTVGWVKGTKYLLKTRHHTPRTTPHGKTKTVSLHFSSKRRGTIIKIGGLKNTGQFWKILESADSLYSIYPTLPSASCFLLGALHRRSKFAFCFMQTICPNYWCSNIFIPFIDL